MTTKIKTKRVLILASEKSMAKLLEIHLGGINHDSLHLDITSVRCSDEVEVNEIFDLTLVNETKLLEHLSENKNLLIQNLGKLVVLTDYKSEINRLKGKYPEVRFFKKQNADGFSEQIKITVIRELNLVKPMEILID